MQATDLISGLQRQLSLGHSSLVELPSDSRSKTQSPSVLPVRCHIDRLQAERREGTRGHRRSSSHAASATTLSPTYGSPALSEDPDESGGSEQSNRSVRWLITEREACVQDCHHARTRRMAHAPIVHFSRTYAEPQNRNKGSGGGKVIDPTMPNVGRWRDHRCRSTSGEVRNGPSCEIGFPQTPREFVRERRWPQQVDGG